jgi:hypothetical protein
VTLSSAQLQTKLAALIETEKANVPPKIVYSTECHKKLTAQHIDDGVYLFSRYLGMSGSSKGLDLYCLNRAYLLDPAMKQRFNEILREWKRPD